MNKKIILASASPRRRELLTQIGLDFDVVVSETEEKITSTEPAKVVEELSAQKAEAVWGWMHLQIDADSVEKIAATQDYIVIGADTVVACGGKILGKPGTVENAVVMLRMLQGREHEVYTGVTILSSKNGEQRKLTFHERTVVHFSPMSEEEIREYVATGDPMDKAGAYGIQGFCARYISGIEGDYNNVVGLPVGRVYQELRRLQLL